MRSLIEYFSRRWTGVIPLNVLLVRDMLILGTLINVATTTASLVALGSGAAGWIGLIVFLLPVPYNLFIFLCVWRFAGRLGGVWGNLSCVVAALWLAGATIL
jgi:hypothetical protein